MQTVNLELSVELESLRQQVDASMIKAIITQESNWNPYAIRFEPGWKYVFDAKRFARAIGISEATETNTQMSSWGLGQLMGTVVRELGFVGHMGVLFDSEINIFYICLYVKKLSLKAKKTEQLFACYNGGLGAILNLKGGKFPNQEYVDSVMKHYEFFRSGGMYGKK